jgi:hypothetical protein
MIKAINLIGVNFSSFVKADYTAYESSCIKHQVTEMTDIHKQYGGFPSTYEYDNTKIHQLWWEDPELKKVLGEKLNIEVVSISSIMQDPGCIIPVHRDMFHQIVIKYPHDTRLKVRANIFLEDWKMGHFLQYHDKIVDPWKAGEGFMWDSEVLHLSANAGLQNKYTMQVSGFLN